MIRLEQVTKIYGQNVAVSDLNLNVVRGEVFAFLGPNGAGKTTTIKMIVGLLRATRGKISVAGIDVVTHAEDANRLIGYVPDQPYLYEKLSGREFLKFTADLYGLSPSRAEQQIAQQIKDFRLEPFVDQLAEGYSHGMKQRLVFASALVHDPPVMVVDEPMVGLDPRSMRDLKDLLRRRADAGGTVFMSTHTLPVAEEIADRIGIIDGGKMQFLGSCAELREELAGHDSSLERLYLQITEVPE